jgi:hypothetical protein
MDTITPLEAKIAKFLHTGITNAVVKASSNRYFCRFNLHNNTFLKRLNNRLNIAYRTVFDEKSVVEAPYNYGSEDGVENALLAIRQLIDGGYTGNREYLFKRLDYLTNRALNDLYDRNHRDWIQRIDQAIHAAKVQEKPVVKARRRPVDRPRDKKGRFTKLSKKRKTTHRRK